MLLNKLDKYYETNSIIHKMNSLVKMLCFIIFIITIVSNDLMINLILIDFLVILIFLSRVPVSIYLEIVIRFKFVLLFIFIISLLCGITIVTSIVIIIKIILIIWYLSLLTLTTGQSEITYSLELILKPLSVFKVPVNKVALKISFALRFIPMLFNQIDMVLKRLASLGLNYQANFKSRFKAYYKAIIPVLVLTFNKIRQIKQNMEIRLFSINRRRTNYRSNKVSLFDVIILIIHVGLLFLMMRLEGMQ